MKIKQKISYNISYQTTRTEAFNHIMYVQAKITIQ
jgi:hypothetical protein